MGRNGGEILLKSGKVRRFSADVDLNEESRLIVQQQVTKPVPLLCSPTPLYSRMAPTGSSFYKMSSLSTYSHLLVLEVKVAGKSARALAESSNMGTGRWINSSTAYQGHKTTALGIFERWTCL